MISPTPNSPSGIRPLRDGVETLVAALCDPARRGRNVLVVLIAYTAVWTLYGVFAKSSQDLHFDMVELFSLSRDLALGYPKHPPLATYIVGLWFLVFPAADWAYYLLAITLAALSLWIAWLLACRYLDAEKSVAALALLTLVPFFNFHALKFNVNTVLLPLWAATTLWFLRSFETRSAVYAALAGIGAAGAMLGKYWSIFLLAGLGLAALLDHRRGSYFRSSAPWITVATGAFLIAPHAAWLIGHDFAPFSYAVAIHGTKTFATTFVAMLGYFAGALAYVAVPVLLAIILLRPSAAAIRDALLPATADRRLIAIAFWGPLAIPAIFSLAAGVKLTSLWSMSGWSLLPIVLLSSPLVIVTRRALVQLVIVALAVPLAVTLLAPVIALAIHVSGLSPDQMHSRLLAKEIERHWRETTRAPLRLIGGDLAYGAAFYLPGHPTAFPGTIQKEAPWMDESRLSRDGVALVCRAGEASCVSAIEPLVMHRPGARRVEVELTRGFLGTAAPPERYLIFTVPPRN